MSRYGWKYKKGERPRFPNWITFLISFNGTRPYALDRVSSIYYANWECWLPPNAGWVYTKLELKWGAVILTSFLYQIRYSGLAPPRKTIWTLFQEFDWNDDLIDVTRRRTVNSWLDTHTYNFESSKCVCVHSMIVLVSNYEFRSGIVTRRMHYIKPFASTRENTG